MRLVDLTGQRFGRLVIVERVENSGKKPAWLCRCDCGATKIADGGRLKSGGVRSCGCLRREWGSTMRRNHASHGHTVGGSLTTTYRTWSGMIQRTTNPRCDDWHNYGGRGITVCDRWRTFASFLADMGERPAGLTLDRVDNDRGYEPGNCRWATKSEQQRNQRRRNVH